MKTKLVALILFVTTAIGISLAPSIQQVQAITGGNSTTPPQAHKIEVVFILDTTSSMSGLIQAAKEKIWSIATTMASAQQAPDIRMGLVAFRDRGDTYVTRVLDLSQDLDSMYASLMDFKARGGGDGPESVNQALYDAINRISWSEDDSVYKVVFLIGDAPPHMDYNNDVKFPVTLEMAKRKGIIVNTIQSGQNHSTAPVWKHIAQLGYGEYFQVENSGNAIAVVTPYDKKLSELAASLEDTRLYFGNKEEKAKQEKRNEATRKLHDELSEAALARRATFNATASGESNFLGEGELVDAISSGRIELDDIDKDDMPASLQALAPADQMEVITNQARQRDLIKHDIQKLSEFRNAYIVEQIGTRDDAKESLDEKIYSAVKKQAKTKGLIYESEAARY
ncbi:MAG: VWA domain-containing protein [Gammaproteobacteria bacterium]|nr:VWA domain-containing protein [Gammaproteobacteria bacterium]